MSTQVAQQPDGLCFDNNFNTYCQSDFELYPWLSIKYPEPIRTKKVSVSNRVDCCGGTLRDIVVTVGNVARTAKNQIFRDGTQLGDKFFGGVGVGSTVDFVADQAIEGTVVTIQLETSEILQFSEVVIHQEDDGGEFSYVVLYYFLFSFLMYLSQQIIQKMSSKFQYYLKLI